MGQGEIRMIAQSHMTPYLRQPDAVLSFFLAGDSIAVIADDLSLTPDECEEMLRIAVEVSRLPRRKGAIDRILARVKPGNTLEQDYHIYRVAALYSHVRGVELPDWFSDRYRVVSMEMIRRRVIG